MMKNSYVILSNKSWNSDLVDKLKTFDSTLNWIHIKEKSEFTIENLELINPIKIFIPHWSHYIPEKIYTKYECLVFHMTDLPFGRGGSPLQNLIEKGIENTKITALRVSKELDSGAIYLKKKLNLFGSAEEIYIRANNIIFTMIIDIINSNIIPEEQTGEVTTFQRRTPNMSNIEGLEDLEAIYNYIRMLDAEGYPHAYLETKLFKFEFTRAQLKANKSIKADVRIFKK